MKRLSKEVRRTQIARAALRLLGLYGANQLTTAQLAKEVGISEGAIFRHFENKLEIIDQAISLLESLLESSFPASELSPLQRLKEFFFARFQLLKEYPEIKEIVFSDQLIKIAGEKGAERVKNLLCKSINFLRDNIILARERGEINGNLPVEILIWSVIGILQGITGTAPHSFISQQCSFQSNIPPEHLWLEIEKILNCC